jgi:hypothetical protein
VELPHGCKLLCFPCRARDLGGLWSFLGVLWSFQVGHCETEATLRTLALLIFERSALTGVPRLQLIGALARRLVIIHTEHRSEFR